MKTEKLNALADEAGFEITPWGNESLPCVHQEGPIDVELKKFAELIVRECADWVSQSVVRDKGHIPQDPHSVGWNAAVAYASKELKKKFGVK